MSHNPIELALTLFTQFWREPDIIVDRMDRASITVPHSGEIILGMARKLTELFPYPEGVLSQDTYRRSVEQLAIFFNIEPLELQHRLQRKGIPFIQIEVQEETKNQMVYLLTVSAALEIVHLRASEQVNGEIMSNVKEKGLDEATCFKKLQDLIYVADSTYSFLVNIQILQMYASLLGKNANGSVFQEIKEQLLSKIIEKIS